MTCATCGSEIMMDLTGSYFHTSTQDTGIVEMPYLRPPVVTDAVFEARSRDYFNPLTLVEPTNRVYVMKPETVLLLAIARLSVDRPDLEEICSELVDNLEDTAGGFKDCRYEYTQLIEEYSTPEKSQQQRRIRTNTLDKENL